MQWSHALCASAIALSTATLLGSSSTVITFASTRLGTPPDGFRFLSSSPQEAGRWTVERLGGATALVQGELGQGGYRLAVYEQAKHADVHVGARLKVGEGDRAAGLAWRIQDEGTYYAARLDFDQREIVLYKFVRGNRIRLDRRGDVRVDPTHWHELVVEHRAARIYVWLNGVPVLREDDESLREAGPVGLWMPGDGTAGFERLWLRPLLDKAP